MQGSAPPITPRTGEGRLMVVLPVTQSWPDFGICCQVFSSLSSVSNLLGISAPGQQDHWCPLEAKHRGTGDVTLQRLARQRGDSLCADLGCDSRLCWWQQEAQELAGVLEPQCPALLAGVIS